MPSPWQLVVRSLVSNASRLASSPSIYPRVLNSNPNRSNFRFGTIFCSCTAKMPRAVKNQERDAALEKKHETEHINGGSVYRLMRRVHSLEDLLKKLRWERNAVHGQQQQHPDSNDDEGVHVRVENSASYGGESRVFEMPLHYPRYSKEDYASMPEWRLDLLFQEYGLAVTGDVAYKRDYAKGAFLWPDEQ